MTTETSKVGYQFTPMPKQLTHLLDVNLRSMLFTLVDASNYFADEDGWFFRTNELFQLDSALSKNLVIATIDTLFQHSLVEVSCSGTGKGRKPNNYRLNLDSFKFFEQLDMNTDLYRPENRIETVKYKGTGYHATYLDDEPVRYLPELVKGKIIWNPANPTNAPTTDDTTVPTSDTTKELTTNVTKSEHNIDNIDSIYNKEYIKNIEDIEYKENVNNIEYNNSILNNNILREKQENEEIEKEFGKGVTEPMTRYEEEVKEDPNEYQFININPYGDNQYSIPGEVQEEGSCEDCSSQSQPIEEEPRPASHKELQDYFRKRLRREFKEKIPESEEDIQQSREKLFQELESFSDIRDYRLVGYMIKDACEKETDRLMERILAA